MIASLQNILESAENKDDFWESFESSVKKDEKRLLGIIDGYKKLLHVSLYFPSLYLACTDAMEIR